MADPVTGPLVNAEPAAPVAAGDLVREHADPADGALAVHIEGGTIGPIVVSGRVDQGDPNVIAKAWPVELTTDGVNVAGTAAHPMAVTNTGANLVTQGSDPWIVSGPGGAILGALELDATAVTGNASLASIDGKVSTAANQATEIAKLAGGLPAALGAGGGVKIDGSGTALPVSGTVSVTGGATSANQTTQITAEQATQASVASIDSKTPNLGQQLAAASSPVVLTAAQLATLAAPVVSGTVAVSSVAGTVAVSAAALPLPANAAQETGGNLATIAGRLPTSLGGAQAASGALAVAPSQLSLSGPTTSIASGGNAIKASAGVFYTYNIVNLSVAIFAVFYFNVNSAPGAGAAYVYAGASLAIGGSQNPQAFAAEGWFFSVNIWRSLSSTGIAVGYTAVVGSTTVNETVIFL